MPGTRSAHGRSGGSPRWGTEPGASHAPGGHPTRLAGMACLSRQRQSHFHKKPSLTLCKLRRKAVFCWCCLVLITLVNFTVSLKMERELYGWIFVNKKMLPRTQSCVVTILRMPVSRSTKPRCCAQKVQYLVSR